MTLANVMDESNKKMATKNKLTKKRIMMDGLMFLSNNTDEPEQKRACLAKLMRLLDGLDAEAEQEDDVDEEGA